MRLGGPKADRAEHAYRDEHHTGEEVLDESDEGRVADARDGEVPLEQSPVGLDDREDQHAEAPEGERVCRAG